MRDKTWQSLLAEHPAFAQMGFGEVWAAFREGSAVGEVMRLFFSFWSWVHQNDGFLVVSP